MLRLLFLLAFKYAFCFWKVSNLDVEESPLVTFFPKSVCYSSKPATRESCPNLFQCVHRGQIVSPERPLILLDSCEDYRCSCPVGKIKSNGVKCKHGYMNCQWKYEGCQLMKTTMNSASCLYLLTIREQLLPSLD
ncbi:Oidioi.mRNA.OKI2018_I69.XSR.g15019.t1.cds [Oikopleura dioica]|uniref:Oidioi.mRNA.OKI2018_I69.XSR.g15019.t1.cds n=1 Tax=Oikopleura dioica TaxID=34765 RepID=A0ABN7SBI8_OIKDI|nr:Oidioi.mRNA.OKI2018_I69.XSR.g15019.t1.cds [Oikopleura dioica]